MGFPDDVASGQDPADSLPPVDEELEDVDELEQSEAEAELQEENAGTSLDQPSQ